jgi:hypothetical protein
VPFNAPIDLYACDIDFLRLVLSAGPKVNNVQKLSELRNAGMNVGALSPRKLHSEKRRIVHEHHAQFA